MHPSEDINIVDSITTTTSTTPPTSTTSDNTTAAKTTRLFNNILKTANATNTSIKNETEMVSVNTTPLPS